MSVFSKIKEAFVKSEDKDKYLSGLDRSKKKVLEIVCVLYPITFMELMMIY